MIRAYRPEDFPSVIQLFQLNTPQYFAPEEQHDLEEYLGKHAQHFFIFEKDQRIQGAGGYNLLEDEARISWYFIHPDAQGQGIGKALVQHSLNELKKAHGVPKIMVRTSQHAWRFFEKMGFELKMTEKDFWAPGFDLYQMELKTS